MELKFTGDLDSILTEMQIVFNMYGGKAAEEARGHLVQITAGQTIVNAPAKRIPDAPAKRRGRPPLPKADSAQVVAQPVPVSRQQTLVVEEADPIEDHTPGPMVTETPVFDDSNATIADVRKVIGGIMKGFGTDGASIVRGMQSVNEFLAPFGTERISELAESQYPAVMAAGRAGGHI